MKRTIKEWVEIETQELKRSVHLEYINADSDSAKQYWAGYNEGVSALSQNILKRMIVPPKQSEYNDYRRCDEYCKFCNPEDSRCERMGVTIEPYAVCIYDSLPRKMKAIEPELLKQKCDMDATELCHMYRAKSDKRKEPCTYGSSHGIKYCPYNLLTVGVKQ